MLGEDGARLDCGQTVARAQRSGDGRLEGRREDVQRLTRDHDRHSVSIAMIVTGVGLGDAGPFRRGGTDVRRGVVALVAIGDGADAEGARVTCSPQAEGDLRHDIGGRTRWCTVAMFIALIFVIGTGGSTRSPCACRCKGRRRRALLDCGQTVAD